MNKRELESLRKKKQQKIVHGIYWRRHCALVTWMRCALLWMKPPRPDWQTARKHGERADG